VRLVTAHAYEIASEVVRGSSSERVAGRRVKKTALSAVPGWSCRMRKDWSGNLDPGYVIVIDEDRISEYGSRTGTVLAQTLLTLSQSLGKQAATSAATMEPPAQLSAHHTIHMFEKHGWIVAEVWLCKYVANLFSTQYTFDSYTHTHTHTQTHMTSYIIIILQKQIAVLTKVTFIIIPSSSQPQAAVTPLAIGHLDKYATEGTM
jgi:hypothetical protein